ncbi:hypothetical protein HUW63_31065 [Myxococcus sp. AM001]|nr:hypothetical protein [Myxococcus sp. AM001]
MDRVRECWSSAYGQRVVAYRRSQGMSEEPILAVVVQDRDRILGMHTHWQMSEVIERFREGRPIRPWMDIPV